MSDSRVATVESQPRSSSWIAARLPALAHRNYRLFFFGQFVSVTGTWMQTLAQSWLVLTMTGSALKLGLVNVMQFTPILVFGLFAGLIADRFPKRSILLCTQSCAALLALTLAVLDATDHVQLWHVYLLAAGLGIVNSFDMPARQAFAVELVGTEDLPNAIALNSSIFNAGRLIGPALAGLFLAAFGTAICFGINAVSYLGAITALLLMRLPAREAVKHGSRVGGLKAGFAYIRTAPRVRHCLLLVGLVAMFALNFNVWIPLLAKNDFHSGPSGFGFLMASLGLGSLVGALFLAFFVQQSRPSVMLNTALLLGVAEILVALVAKFEGHLAAGMLIAPLMGFGMTVTMATANTTVQTNTPNELRGRIMSVYMTVFAGTAPLGAIVAGAISGLFSAPVSLALGGSVAIATALYLRFSGAFSAEPVRQLPN